MHVKRNANRPRLHRGALVGLIVWLAPLAGWSSFAPSNSYGAATTTSICKKYLFIGIRGSGEATGTGTAANTLADYSSLTFDYKYPENNFGRPVYRAFDRFRKAVGDSNVRRISIDYPAVSATRVGNYLGGGDFLKSVNWGVEWLKDTLKGETDRCAATGEKIIVSGYSQGALVAHETLAGKAMPNLKGSVLIADPELKLETGMRMFGTAETHAKGLWTRFLSGSYRPLGYPMAAKTAEVCNNGDVVCAPGVFDYASTLLTLNDTHTSYHQSAYVDQAIDYIRGLLA